MKKIFYSLAVLTMTALTFTSCEDVPEPYPLPTESGTPKEEEPAAEPAGKGTVDEPYNVAGAFALIATLGADENSADVYVKGIISQIDELSTSFGNATYYISDTGTSSNQLEVYRGYSLGGEKFVSADEIKVGDEVIILGKLVNFRGNTPEFTQGSSIYSLNGKTEGGEVSGVGSYDNPYDVASAIAKGSAEGVYLKGFIVGYVEGQAYESGANFSNTGDNVSITNILLGPSASEKDPAKCMPIQLPNGDIRKGLNLKENADNLGKEVLLYGDIATYFSVPGFKNTSYAEISGKSIGTKAQAKRRVRK